MNSGSQHSFNFIDDLLFLPIREGMLMALKTRNILTILLVIWLAQTSAYADVLRIKTCISKLADGQDISAAMAQSSAFMCNTEQTALGSGDFLTKLVFAPVQPKTQDPLVLRLGSDWQDSSRITFRFADGAAEHI